MKTMLRPPRDTYPSLETWQAKHGLLAPWCPPWRELTPQAFVRLCKRDPEGAGIIGHGYGRGRYDSP